MLEFHASLFCVHTVFRVIIFNWSLFLKSFSNENEPFPLFLFCCGHQNLPANVFVHIDFPSIEKHRNLAFFFLFNGLMWLKNSTEFSFYVHMRSVCINMIRHDNYSISFSNDLCFAFARNSDCIGGTFDRHNKIVLGHERIFGDKMCESMTQISFIFEFVKYMTMMKICMWKNSINSTTYGAQFTNRRLFDWHSESKENRNGSDVPP